MRFIDLDAIYQRQKPQIDAAINKVLSHGQYVMGPEIHQLESVLADFVGVEHAVVTSSGTSALLMALMALGVGPGDEVITTGFSFFATAEVIAQLGAKPVFVDINPITYNLNASLIEAAISDKTKAIMPVSLYGQMADLEAINAIAEKANIAVIEDGAQSFGAEQLGRRSGSRTTLGCTSFFPAKPLGCFGDGGACFTNDAALAEQVRVVLNHGQSSRYHHERLGMTGRMDTLQAAVLLEKIKNYPQEIELRQQVATWYGRYLPTTIGRPVIKSGNLSVYAQYTIEVELRDSVVYFLKKQGIPTAVHYPSGLHQQPAILNLGYETPSLPITQRVCQQVLSLPFHPYMPQSDVQKVCQALSLAVEQGVLI